MKKIKVGPCLNCDKRTPTCHGECQAYMDFYNHNREAEEYLAKIKFYIKKGKSKR